MALADIVIVLIVCRRDLDSAGPKLAVHHRVRDNWDAASRNERVADKLAMKVLFTHSVMHESAWFLQAYRVPGILWMDRNSRITEHGLWTSRRDNDALFCTRGFQKPYEVTSKASLTRALDGICERRDHTELDLLVRIAGNGQERPPGKLEGVDLQVGQGRVELCAPVNESIRAVDDAVLEQLAKILVDGTSAALVGVTLSTCLRMRLLRTSSIVNAARLQSKLAPSRRIWDEMRP